MNIGLKRVLRIIRIPKNELVVVGDQIFTDILAGKFAGIRTILVDPVSQTSEFPATRVMRMVEKIIGRSGWEYDRLGKSKME